MQLVPPISEFNRRQPNNSLHGRSVHRTEDTNGHDVIWGHTAWPRVGDAIDLAAHGGTPVFGVFDGTITEWKNDATKIEWIYLKSADGKWLAIYAHIDFMSHDRSREGAGIRVRTGEQLGTVRGDLRWDHLHFELIDLAAGRAATAANPPALQQKLWELFQGVAPGRTDLKVVGPDNQVIDCSPVIEGGTARADLRPLVEALGCEPHYRRHPDGRERIYVKPAGVSTNDGSSAAREARPEVPS